MEVILRVPSQEEMMAESRAFLVRRVAENFRQLGALMGDQNLVASAEVMARAGVARVWPRIEAIISKLGPEVAAAMYVLMVQRPELQDELTALVQDEEFIQSIVQAYNEVHENGLGILGYPDSSAPAVTATIVVVNVRGQDPSKWLDPATWPHNTVRTYIGRRCGGWPQSPLANPYRIGPEMTRSQAIHKFRLYLEGHASGCWADPGNPVQAELVRLARLINEGMTIELGCWCAPEPCHGDIVAVAIRKVAEQIK